MNLDVLLGEVVGDSKAGERIKNVSDCQVLSIESLTHNSFSGFFLFSKKFFCMNGVRSFLAPRNRFYFVCCSKTWDAAFKYSDSARNYGWFRNVERFLPFFICISFFPRVCKCVLPAKTNWQSCQSFSIQVRKKKYPINALRIPYVTFSVKALGGV